MRDNAISLSNIISKDEVSRYILPRPNFFITPSAAAWIRELGKGGNLLRTNATFYFNDGHENYIDNVSQIIISFIVSQAQISRPLSTFLATSTIQLTTSPGAEIGGKWPD